MVKMLPRFSQGEVEVEIHGDYIDREAMFRKGRRCPYCQGVGVIIARFGHKTCYDCPLCKGKGKIDV